jgi:hypothetical protein
MRAMLRDVAVDSVFGDHGPHGDQRSAPNACVSPFAWTRRSCSTTNARRSRRCRTSLRPSPDLRSVHSTLGDTEPRLLTRGQFVAGYQRVRSTNAGSGSASPAVPISPSDTYKRGGDRASRARGPAHAVAKRVLLREPGKRRPSAGFRLSRLVLRVRYRVAPADLPACLISAPLSRSQQCAPRDRY